MAKKQRETAIDDALLLPDGQNLRPNSSTAPPSKCCRITSACGALLRVQALAGHGRDRTGEEEIGGGGR
jgi:hypothetical protein